MTTLDVPANWRLLTYWSASTGLPDPDKGVYPIHDCQSVLIALEHDLIEVRDWLAVNTREAVRLFGRFDFMTYAYRIDRHLTGINFAFADEDEAFFFKMRWG